MIAGWWYLAPPQLGGATSFVTVDGTSMLPGIHRSDIVALRPANQYQVGDVVGYQSHLLHRVVLHRIVAIHNGRYTFEGDNNGFLDPEHPTRAQLVGKRWFQLPTIGRLVGIFHTPWILAALAGLLVLLIGLGERQEPATDEP
jgi:signal peptidase I